MSRASAALKPSPRRALTGLAAASLLALAACGGTADDPAETGASTTEAAASPQDSGTHAHREGASHAHDGAGGHTHAGADTVASGVALDPGPEAGWTGSVTLMAVGDSLRVLVSVEGLPAGARRRAELVAGSCDDPGSELATLAPVAVGSSGEGSSQTTLPTDVPGDHGHGAVRLLAGDGSPAACAAVHLPGAGHTHG